MRILNKYFWTNFWYEQISSRIRPRNKWATKCIPRTWVDKDSIFELVLYAGIIDFVEKERCFDVTDWSYDETHKQNDNKIREIYSWAKTGRKEKEEEMSAAYPKENDLSDIKNWGKNVTKESYNALYGKVD